MRMHPRRGGTYNFAARFASVYVNEKYKRNRNGSGCLPIIFILIFIFLLLGSCSKMFT